MPDQENTIAADPPPVQKGDVPVLFRIAAEIRLEEAADATARMTIGVRDALTSIFAEARHAHAQTIYRPGEVEPTIAMEIVVAAGPYFGDVGKFPGFDIFSLPEEEAAPVPGAVAP